MRNSSGELTSPCVLRGELGGLVGGRKVVVFFLDGETLHGQKLRCHLEILGVDVLELLAPGPDGFEVELVEVGGPLGVGRRVDFQQAHRPRLGRGQSVKSVEDFSGGVVDQGGVAALHQVFEEEEGVKFVLWKDFGVFDEHFEIVNNVAFEVAGEATAGRR